jgi:membrane-associated phospholipid phosphatase
VWGYLHLTQADYPAIIPVAQETHLPIFHGLRDGTFRALTAMTAEGIITFPSFHAALAVIFAVALWPVPILLRWIGLALNILMIASTPIDGGHYFIDVIAGIAIGTFCVIAVRSSFLGRGGPPRIRLAKPRKSPSATSNHNF